jgi:hypothetical protein
LGYVKEMSRLECAAETMRLAMEELAGIGVKKRPEFWDRMWVLYVQSEVDWRLSKTERQSRYRQCGQDKMRLGRLGSGRLGSNLLLTIAGRT